MKLPATGLKRRIHEWRSGRRFARYFAETEGPPLRKALITQLRFILDRFDPSDHTSGSDPAINSRVRMAYACYAIYGIVLGLNESLDQGQTEHCFAIMLGYVDSQDWSDSQVLGPMWQIIAAQRPEEWVTGKYSGVPVSGVDTREAVGLQQFGGAFEFDHFIALLIPRFIEMGRGVGSDTGRAGWNAFSGRADA